MPNPTPPANSTPDFLAGWNARALADGTLPPAAPVPAPRTSLIPLSAALIATFSAAQKGDTLQLGAGIYILPSQATIVADGVRVIGDPAGTTIMRKSVAGSTTGILLAGANIEIAGITFDSDKPLGAQNTPNWNAKVSVNALRVTGQNAYIHNCTAKNVDDFIFLASTATGAKIEDNTTGIELRADAIYIEQTANVSITGNNIPQSQQEHGIRLDTLDGKTAPTNITISGNTIGNSDGKESIAIRFGKNVTVTNNTLNAWTRVNQGVQTPAVPNAGCANITYAGNTFGPGAYITINPYTPGVVIHSNNFHLNAADVAVNIQGPGAVVSLDSNFKIPIEPGTPLKPLIHSYGAVELTGTDAADLVKS